MYSLNNFIFIGILLGVIYTFCILPRKTNDNPKIKLNFKPFIKNGMFIMPINKKYYFHLHHWIIFYISLLFLKYKYYNNIILGFSLVMIFQGTLYNDFLKFIYIFKN